MADDAARTRELLVAAREGRPGALAGLFPIVYEQLRSIAHGWFGSGRAGAHDTLQPTGLVHEAFVKLAGADAAPKDREHFLAIAAKAMREILVDRARRRSAGKRGGGRTRATLGGDLDQLVCEGGGDDELLALDEAMRRLAELDERQARIVELRFFGGMTGAEIAAHEGVSRNTVVRELTMARAWLLQQLDEPGGAGD